jgi:hypothetical protein
VMTLNGVKEGDGAAVVQQFRARANTPERRSAHFLSGFLAAGFTVASDRKHDFAKLRAGFQIGVGCGGFGERKNAVNDGLEAAGSY